MKKRVAKKVSPRELEEIPGVGRKVAQYMRNIGINRVEDLKGKEADKLYAKLCKFTASPVDRCMLYVFRCAIYYAENSRHKPQLLKWWNWKVEAKSGKIL